MAMSSAAYGAAVVKDLLDGRGSREQLVRDYERKIRHSLNSLSWLIYRINSPLMRDIFMGEVRMRARERIRWPAALVLLAGALVLAPIPWRRLRPRSEI